MVRTKGLAPAFALLPAYHAWCYKTPIQGCFALRTRSSPLSNIFTHKTKAPSKSLELCFGADKGT